MAEFPDYSPDLDSDYEREERLNRTAFGDGYTQVTGDGIRPYSDAWNLSFSNRPRVQIDEIKEFLDGLSGATFTWQSPLSDEPTNWKYIDNYRMWRSGPDAYGIEFRIEGVTL